MRRVIYALALMAPMAAMAEDIKPAAVVAEGVPAIPEALVRATQPYLEFRTASLVGWNVRTHGIAISTRFGNVAQIHDVAMPLGMRRQITFEADAIAGASYARKTGDVMVVQKDVGGSEFWQLYRLDQGRLVLLTDGKSRNTVNAWSHDGKWLAYTSTRRNGADSDIYVIDPRDPKSDRRVAELKGGGWTLRDFAPDGKSAILANRISITKVDLFRLDLASGAQSAIGDHNKSIAYDEVAYAPDGTLWVTSDEYSDVQRLGRLDPSTGRFTPVAQEKWDVEDFVISDDGRFIAYLTNEAGISRLRLYDVASNTVRLVQALPTGVISGLSVAPWGEIGLTLASAKSPADVWSVDPVTLAAKRWTQSETGGLDPNVNAAPELVSVKSFDGEVVSGFLYRPDPKKFPGKRPLLFSIHGGPESQSRPGFLGRNNYLVNELGIALFLPNVRGSSGYGKRFVSLDNGPDLRENSVKDIGAFLDKLAKDPGIDAARIAETGGSYGGYMCYASAIRYGARLKAANCIVAISNFVTFLENTQSYRRDLRRVEYGDERDPAQRAKLIAISPFTKAKSLHIPLMVQTGGNDPRVPPSEATQMVEAVRANGGPVWHLLAKDEGHGFAKKANQDYAFWASLVFWKRYLLGEAP
ncbi:dipeptidyl aminopeptidase/acylaminoacyl peptidase [Rhizomicrobium palustre]|uniref:Dipeptidyl aminopeptidase/acylaminoacyl peptidase n=1 Tax=Rhizomicrobium palustre TaxID=189966 RepID=A0A846N068_9PROT|nr:prolyl oligopeptidase family serine peptidase [Rhizomicrobium palustre]NIK89258.1 dipeptidyl aminopeptidase/acylaminoacyl peptidase [Rhizomicrobium palustre]